MPEAGGHTASVKLPVAAALAFLLWKKRNALLSERVLRAFIFAALAAFALFNSYKVAISLARPTWQVRTISNELTRILPQGRYDRWRLAAVICNWNKSPCPLYEPCV